MIFTIKTETTFIPTTEGTVIETDWEYLFSLPEVTIV